MQLILSGVTPLQLQGAVLALQPGAAAAAAEAVAAAASAAAEAEAAAAAAAAAAGSAASGAAAAAGQGGGEGDPNRATISALPALGTSPRAAGAVAAAAAVAGALAPRVALVTPKAAALVASLLQYRHQAMGGGDGEGLPWSKEGALQGGGGGAGAAPAAASWSGIVFVTQRMAAWALHALLRWVWYCGAEHAGGGRGTAGVLD